MSSVQELDALVGVQDTVVRRRSLAKDSPGDLVDAGGAFSNCRIGAINSCRSPGARLEPLGETELKVGEAIGRSSSVADPRVDLRIVLLLQRGANQPCPRFFQRKTSTD